MILTEKPLIQVKVGGEIRNVYGFEDHGYVKVTFVPSGKVMYFDVGVSRMGEYGGPDHWWSRESNVDFRVELDTKSALPWDCFREFAEDD